MIQQNGSTRRWAVFLCVALIAGTALRLIWLGDIEYKGDERLFFLLTQPAGVTEPLPTLGPPGSVGLRAPGMHSWVMLLLGYLFAVRTPLDLARAVQVLNVAALVALVVFAFRMIRLKEREPWLWAAALASVNPYLVLLHRKIWPPATLALFCLLPLAGWFRRDKKFGAFLWGLGGLLVGQVHVAALFYMAGLAVWTFAAERGFGRRERPAVKTAWPFWIAGSLVGTLPLVPWLLYMAHISAQVPRPPLWQKLIALRFWGYWGTDALGLHAWYNLGRPLFRDFLGYPLVGGRPTYLVGALHALLAVAGAAMLVAALIAFLRRRRSSGSNRVKNGESERDETGLALRGALWGGGAVMTVLAPTIYRHYLLITFPFEWVWLARLARDGLGTHRARMALLTVWIAQLALSMCLLYFLHVNGGAPTGDYGVAYDRQQAGRRGLDRP
jgi:hypothetical protein